MKDHKKSSFLFRPGLNCEIHWRADAGLSDFQQAKCRTLIEVALKEIQQFLYQSWHLHGGRKLPHSIEIGLSLVGKKRIKFLNDQYRQKNKATDVLSFPLYDKLRSHESVLLEPFCLGDVVVCWSVLTDQAKHFDIPWTKEFLYLFIHGVLHLLDFDHERGGREEELMFYWEEVLVEKSWEHYQKMQAKR